jgi:hypothetical protein
MTEPARIDSVVRRLPLITNSEQKCFRRCAREHHYAYELGIRSIDEAEALRFGSLVHVGLEAFWRALHAQQQAAASANDAAPLPTPLTAAIDAMAPNAADEFDLVRAGVMMQGYDARWAEDEYEVLAVEVEFRAPLINPATGQPSRTYMVAGKLDAIVRRRRDGLIFIVEHKTSSEDIGVGSKYWARLQIDSQISIYFAGARALGYEPAGCVYDVLAKPRIAPLKATPLEARKMTKRGELYANQRAEDETANEFRERLVGKICEDPDRWYQRGEVVRLESEEREAAFDVWQTARSMREGQLAARYPRNPESCERYGRVCNYFSVCTGSGSLEDAGRFERVANVHQELSESA